ncbi:hypothetical protein G6011_04456 [Alternaria panax]|uniref:Uncharacterized protein n=1 Tax=Alternaria panax TaxID=48097 RepID=A0AAD4NSN3_9PLEO|nr:hypothetical protein G6011_04456 [Alternaria panax]
MVRDPQFWKRFSVAVHQDDLEKTIQDPKQSYVQSSLSSPSHSPLGSPTSQSHPSPAFLPMVQLPSERSSFASSPPSPLSGQVRASQIPREKKQRPRSKLQKTNSTKPLLRPTVSVQDKPSDRDHDALSPPQRPLCPLPASPSRSFFRAPNISTFSLSLSGRPQSRFNFVTTITADASHRDSWLAKQQRKAKHRTWICWCFWTIFLLLVAGVVVTVLVLKAHNII